MANDLLIGNKHIPRIYFGNIGVASVYFGNKLIWPNNQKRLVAGSEQVAIEYKPKNDIAVTDIGVFTSQSVAFTPHIKIFHSSGLCVAAIDGDTRTANQELYELSGDKRDTVINSTTLYAGQTYYIVYSNGYGNWFPAYFQSEGNYKVYDDQNTASSTTIIEVSPNASVYKPSLFKGLIDNKSDIINMPKDSWFTWIGSSSDYSQGHIFKRTNNGTTYPYSGIIGDLNNYHTISTNDLNDLLSIEIDHEFSWYINDYSGMTKGDIYAKVSDTWSTSTIVDLSKYNSENDKTAAILMALPAMITGSTWWYNNRIGYTIKLKSGYTSKVSSITPLTSLPSNPTDGDIYYLNGSIGPAVGHQTACFAYNGGSYTQIHQSNYTTYFDETPLTDLLTHICSESNLITDENTGNYNFVFKTTETTKKYYLKINGNEV